jgi:hypothetical protein
MTNSKARKTVFAIASVTLVGLVIALVFAEPGSTEANLPIPPSSSMFQIDIPQGLPAIVTIDQRRDRLDISEHRMAKSNLLSDLVAPAKDVRPIKPHLLAPDLVTALTHQVEEHLAQGPQLISSLIEQGRLPSSADTITSGPLNLLAPDVLASDTKGSVVSRTFGSPSAGQRSGAAASTAGAGGVASSAGRTASGLGGRVTGALGL